jgi:outer membrane protein TolC
MLRLALVVMAIAAPLAAHAQPEREPDEPISFDQLLETAVRRSSTLAFVRSTRRQADLAVKTAGARGEWQVQTTAAVDSKHEPGVAAGQEVSIGTLSLTGTIGLATQVSTGAELGVSLDSSKQTRSAGAGSASSVLTSVGVELRQPLLRGLAQGAHVEQHKAKLAAAAAKLQATDDSAGLILDLLSAYWELAYAHATLVVRDKSLALAQSQLDLTRKMHERGTVPDSAIKSARYGVALREEAKLRAKDALMSASLQLRKLAGLELTVELGDLVPSDPLAISTVDYDANEAIAEALAHNPQIAAARLGVSVADVDVRRARNAALPALDVSANASLLGVGADHGDSFRAVGSAASYQVGGVLTLSLSVGGAASAAADAARIRRSDARLSAKDVERNVVAGVIEIVRRLSAAKQRALVAERAIELATANLDTEVALFRADKSSNFLVFQRQTELDEARLLASRAAADALIARATLDYFTGTLLDRYGVEVMSLAKGARHAVP